EVEERLLTERSPVSTGAWVRLFEELSAAIKVQIGDEKIGLEQALARLREADRARRQSASQGITEALKQDIRTRAYIFNVILQDKAIDDRMRNYPSWISSRNLANETSDAAVQALVRRRPGRAQARRSVLHGRHPALSPVRDAELHGKAERRADARPRARPRPPRPARTPPDDLRLPPAADAGGDGERVRRDAHLRPDHGRGDRPQDPALDALRPGRGSLRDSLPPGL